MQDAAVFWDKVAAKYAKSPIEDLDAYTYTLERTRSYLSPEDHVLELGCGTGSTALLLAESVGQITASDLSENMIEVGMEKAEAQGVCNVNFVTAEFFDAALDKGPYDTILALNMLHLLEDLPAAVSRINRLLKPGGIFISKTVCRPGRSAPLKFRLMRLALPFMQWLGKAPYVNFMEVAELEQAVTAGGFKIIESGTYPATSPSRYIVASNTP